MKSPLSFLIFSVVIASSLPSAKASTVIYEQEFFSTSLLMGLPNQQRIGFNVTPLPSTGVLVSVSEASITANETLALSSTGGFRGIGIYLDAASLPDLGIGSYDLSFDIPSFTFSNGDPIAPSNHAAIVSIWTADNFQILNDFNTGITLDAQLAEIRPDGNAEAEFIEQTSVPFPTTGTDFGLSFDYDGSDAVVIFIGVEPGGFPFPAIEFDNILLTPTIPEPSVVPYLLIFAGTMMRRIR